MKNFMRMAFAITLFLLALSISSCGTPQVKVALTSDAKLNLDSNHHSLPVLARVYQLKDKQQFEAANFMTLWKEDTQSLGQELISKEEILLYPGEEKEIPLSRHEETRYIAVVALFRDYKQGEWKVIVPVERKIKLHLENNQLKLATK